MTTAIAHRAIADHLNQTCFCMTLDQDRLFNSLNTAAPGLLDWHSLSTTHPHLFALNPTFVSHADVEAMLSVARAIERVARRPSFQDLALRHAPAFVREDKGTRGLFMGYDFHLTHEGPKLIEINTNAGGAFLNAILRTAQQACCEQVSEFFDLRQSPDFPAKVVNMVQTEWKHQGIERALKTIAIVDENPHGQYLYPEFLLAEAMLERAGFRVFICDPSELNFDGHALMLGETVIDLVYNRLVDFELEAPASRALREAYIASAAVISPGPHHHALLANKRNLVWLSDPDRLAELGVSAGDIEILRAIPQSTPVTPDNAETLWANRKTLFFKPLAGHGGKAVYRGDKLTKSTWANILEHDYIAQSLIPPSERLVKNDAGDAHQKMDIRLYTYDGDLLMTAARIYQGQTTNFRTPGGGFAPIFPV